MVPLEEAGFVVAVLESLLQGLGMPREEVVRPRAQDADTMKKAVHSLRDVLPFNL
jgi:hypothetical protein